MKLMVNEMPKTPQECLYSANGTGKYRCRHDAKLCPINRGGECPHLMAIASPAPVEISAEMLFKNVAESAEPVEPKKRTTKKSTAKKAD
ncbi:MAG: hypothetical protein IIW43_03865 [Selenomonadales bacterium]|nr:hypothetical protein [Selenomonadales bacterium]